MKKKLYLALAFVFIVIQFFRIDKSNPVTDSQQDFIAVTQAPAHISKILHNACYDCHSNQTKYPWYAEIAPVSWWVKHHIDEGKSHLNFSEWGTYPFKKQQHKLEECYEEVEEGEMPLTSYTLLHATAKLDDESSKTLIDWLKSKRSSTE